MMPRLIADSIKSTTITTVETRSTVREAVRRMAERNIGAVLVTHGGRLAGIFTERDLSVRVVAEGLDADATRVEEVMTRDPDVLHPQDSVHDALRTMIDRGYRHLPVVEGERIVGMVSIRDIYGAVKTQLEEDVRSCEAFVFGSGYGA